MDAITKSKIKKSTILITGGTGSFGNSVLGKLLNLSPKQIIILSRDEKKQFDMRNYYNSPLIKFIIGDVRDKESLEKAMRSKVDYIFHAAALKQVPSCEFFPLEAVKTNILGTHNVISLATEYGVKRVVILSTDKAVYPINAMGMTKALMEKVMIADSKQLIEMNNKKTILCGVRYGNVLYSRGSVLPYFIDQIRSQQILSVTNFNMTRFLLPLSNAVDLVLLALARGENGYMYIRKSPACTIETMAKAVCKIFRYDKGYKEVGIRAGEKMHETLVSQEEMMRAKSIGNYIKIPPESQGLEYSKYFSKGRKGKLEEISPYTSENTKRLSLTETINMLKKLPEIKRVLEEYKENTIDTRPIGTYAVLEQH